MHGRAPGRLDDEVLDVGAIDRDAGNVADLAFPFVASERARAAHLRPDAILARRQVANGERSLLHLNATLTTG